MGAMQSTGRYWLSYLAHIVVGLLVGLLIGLIVQNASGVEGWGVWCASAGAVEHVPVAQVSNVVQALSDLKRRGLWIAGADIDAEQDLWEADLTGPLAIVIGGEDKGIGRLVRGTCDFLVRIPMRGRINSLNASVAGALLLFETFRQRCQKPMATGDG